MPPGIVLGTPLDRSGLLFDLWEGDIAEGWQKVHLPSTECPRIPAAFLESERRLLGEALYRREYLAEFAASASGMFDHDLLKAALLPDNFEFNQGSRAGINPAAWREITRAVAGSSAPAPATAIPTGARYANAVLP